MYLILKWIPMLWKERKCRLLNFQYIVHKKSRIIKGPALFRLSVIAYQILARFASSRYIGCPGFMSKAA